jgi:hypothetical protein
MKPQSSVLPMLALLVSACANHAYCERKPQYYGAASVPPIQGAGNLKVPESPTAMRVPPQPPSELAFGTRVPDPKHPGRHSVQCLDQPPPMVEAPAPAATTGGTP